jgi:hypothetical protein
MDDLARVISLPLDEAIAGSQHMKNLRGSESTMYFGGGPALY